MTRARRQPAVPTPERVRAHAVHYLARYAAPRERLRVVLARRALRAAEVHDLDPAPVRAAIDAVVADMARLGLVDDAVFAEARARALAGRGIPPRRIRRRLAEAGVGALEIDAALARLTLDHADPELAAAVVLARRRRLGPFGPEEGRADRRLRELAVLARGGFGYATARRVVDATSPDELTATG